MVLMAYYVLTLIHILKTWRCGTYTIFIEKLWFYKSVQFLKSWNHSPPGSNKHTVYIKQKKHNDQYEKYVAKMFNKPDMVNDARCDTPTLIKVNIG